MKTIFFFLGCIFCLFALQTAVFAKTVDEIKDHDASGKYNQSIDKPAYKPKYLPGFDSDGKSYNAAQSVIYKAINIVLSLAGIIAVLVIIIAGFIYVINAGVESMQNTAKNAILYAVLGLIAVFLSFAVIENTIRYLYDKNEEDTYQPIDRLDQEDVVKISE